MTDADPTWTSTLTLLTRAREGDRQALDALFARYLPALRRWASGRMPKWARDLADTHDLVQETALQVFKKIESFEHRGEGAFQAYLRQAVLNRIRNEVRNAACRPGRTVLDSAMPDDAASPLERAIGVEGVERYEAALQSLREEDRELVIGRLELGLTYSEMAAATDRPSADAARMAVGRAIVRLIEAMKDVPGTTD